MWVILIHVCGALLQWPQETHTRGPNERYKHTHTNTVTTRWELKGPGPHAPPCPNQPGPSPGTPCFLTPGWVGEGVTQVGATHNFLSPQGTFL